MGRCSPPWRAIVLVTAALAVAMLTPIVRETTMFDWLPDPIEACVKPLPAYTGFTLLPWAGFVLAGRLLGYGSARRAARTTSGESWCGWLLGPSLVVCGYALSLPPLYRHSNFWTSSPTFSLRVGVLVSLVPIAYAWTALVRGGRSPIQELGIASLFVYWVHVEMVYA